METHRRNRKTLNQVVKETVDAVYEYLAPHPDGVSMKAMDYGTRGCKVCAKLVNRRIIEKKHMGGGHYKYKWIATMGPTKVLYGSIADELRAEERRHVEDYRRRKKEERKKAENEAGPEKPLAVEDFIEVHEEQPIPAGLPVEEPKEFLSPIDEIRSMWERMKSLGVSIENNQLVLTEVKVYKTVLS